MHRKLSPSSRTSRLALTVLAAVTLFAAPPTRAEAPDDLELVLVTSGLSRPVAVRHAGDGSGRLFIVEQSGVIRIWDGASLLPTPFLDISALVDDGGNEQGLLGLAFHPDYPDNGFFYVNYTRDPGAGLDRTVVARYQVSAGNPNVADAGSALTLLEIEQDFSNHNGGDIHFGPDGYLHIGMGDGGSGGDPNNRAQTPSVLLGKMLRIDVDSGPGRPPDCGLVGNYTIPSSNPFVGVGGHCEEIWALGTRNPWRFSFDRLTGDMFIGDVGQNTIEEIDFEPRSSTPGFNWGWRCYEGDMPFNTAGCDSASAYDFPILQYSHASGNCSVSGGFRYRGSVIGGFFGTYVYADFCSGRTWFATQSGLAWNSTLWADTPYNVSGFGEDEAGELYLINLNGAFYRFESPGAIFADGFESGDVAAWSTSTP